MELIKNMNYLIELHPWNLLKENYSPNLKLTDKELIIMKGLADGYELSEIAKSLKITMKACQGVFYKTLPKINIKNNIKDIVVWSIKNGLVKNNFFSKSQSEKINNLLTDTQKLILQMLVDGNTTNDIANKFKIAKTTVKSHLQAISNISNIPNRRASLIRFGIELGMLETKSPTSIDPRFDKISIDSPLQRIKKSNLTLDKFRVIKKVLTGKSRKQISKELNIDIKTVEDHLRNGMRMIGVKNLYELTDWAIKNKIIKLKPLDINHYKTLFTPTELNVLTLFSQGFNSKEISDKLKVSDKAVWDTKFRLVKKLNTDTKWPYSHTLAKFLRLGFRLGLNNSSNLKLGTSTVEPS